MNSVVIIVLTLSVLASAVKLSLWPWRYAAVICVAWWLLIAASAPWLASLPPVMPDMLAGSNLWKTVMWVDGFAMLAYCMGFANRTLAYRALQWYPGVMCGVSFYFLLTYSFMKFIDANFALCGLAVGALCALLLMFAATVLKRIVPQKSTLVELLYATELIILLLMAIV